MSATKEKHMSTTHPPVVTSKVTAEAVRNADRKLRLAALIDEALDGDYDPMNLVLDWEYLEPLEVRELSDGERRRAALAWLARHVRGLQQIARHAPAFGWEPDKLEKLGDDVSFGVRLSLWGGVGYTHVAARVDAALTCEMVDTGETKIIPATEEQVVPVMAKVCPESIFADIQDEAVA